MFKNGSGYNLSDIAAVTRGSGDGMFGDGNGAWWIILLFLFGWGWGGNGGFGGGNENVRDAVAYGFDINNLENGVRGLEHGICDGFYDMNTSLLTGFGNIAMGNMQNTNAITAQLSNMAATQAQCCCETQRLLERGLCEVNYNILTQSNATNTNIASAARDIIENNNNGVRSILDFLTQDKIATLTAENQALRLTASQQAQNAFLIDQLGTKAPVPAYVVANPYASYGGTYFNTSCGCANI
jgi:hypothetical protein